MGRLKIKSRRERIAERRVEKKENEKPNSDVSWKVFIVPIILIIAIGLYMFLWPEFGVKK